MATERQPYVGPRPFEKEDQELFFGREPETIELSSLIVANPVVLLYAQSGAGKTSLLNAGLIPKLEAKGFEVFPPARVSGAQPRGIELQEINNIYVFNALAKWANPQRSPQQLAHLSLTEFLSERPHLTDDDGMPALRVIVFDQLEEIFTSYPEFSERRKDFFHQLGLALKGEPERRSRGSAFKSSEASAETQIKGDPLLRALLVVREDYLAQIEAFAPLLPEKLRTRIRMERLREEAALAAVTGPLQRTHSRRRFAPGVAERLVTDLMKVRIETAAGKTEVITGEFVEPVQLQVVCQRLFAALPDEVTQIAEKHLAGFGDVSQALSFFYEDCLASAVEQTGVREWDLRMWFTNTLITSAGTRGAVYRGAQDSGGIPNDAVEVLENLHLIRGEQRAGAKWYELTHDRLIEPIQESNREWLSGRWEVEQMRQRLEEKTTNWVRMGRGRGGLLDEVELREVERAPAAELDPSPDQRSLINQSRAAIEEDKREKDAAARRELELAQAVAEGQARAARYLRWLVVVLLIVLAAGMVSVFLWQRYQKRLDRERLSQRLAAQSSALLGNQTELATLLSVEAYRTSQTFEAINALLNAVDYSSYLTASLKDHKNSVTSVAFSPNGKLMASGDRGKNIILWDVAAGKQHRTLTDLQAPVSSVAFSPDGKTLATGNLNKQIILWDVASGQPTRTLTGHTDRVTSVAFNSDGTLLASGSKDNSVILWNPTTGLKRQTLTGHSNEVTCVAFSPDGKILASGSKDQSVIRWDVAAGRQFGQPLAGHNDEVLSLAFSASGKMLASGGADGAILKWDAAGQQLGQQLGQLLTGRNNPITCLAFSSDDILASGDDKGSIILWDAATKRVRSQPLTNHQGAINSIAFNPANSKQFASAGDDAKLILWKIPTQQWLMKPLAPGSADDAETQVTGLAFQPDGQILMAGGWYKGVITWDLDNLQPKAKLTEASVYSLALSNDGKKLAWGVQKGAVLYDLDSRKQTPLLDNRPRVTSLTFSPNGETLAMGLWDGSIVFCDGAGRPLDNKERKHGNEVVNSVAFSPDGRSLASGSRDKTVIIWDVAARKPRIAPLTGHSNGVSSVAFSPDGKILASGGQDNQIILWSAVTGQPLGIFNNGEAVSCLTFSKDKDGKILVSGSEEGTVILWHIDADEQRAALRMLDLKLIGHKKNVYSLTFSQDGKTLASGGGGDNSVILWDVSFDSWAKRACSIANRNLTSEEWKQFLAGEPYRKSCPNLP